MAYKHLSTYLNDHLAGSVTALALLSTIEEAQAGTDMGRLIQTIRGQVEEERDELEAIMKRLEITQSSPRQATAWLAEKLTQLKLHVDNPTDGTLRLFEMLEAVMVGLEGKRALWRSLATIVVSMPELGGVDYEYFAQRSEEQHRQVDMLRLEAAKTALIDHA